MRVYHDGKFLGEVTKEPNGLALVKPDKAYGAQWWADGAYEGAQQLVNIYKLEQEAKSIELPPE